MRIRSEFAGCGSYLPERVVTNAELSAKIDTTDEWIVSRTGIRQRHLAADGELTSDLALKAAERALENAAIPAAEVDMLILATTTPDNTFPATATKIQNRLGMVNGAAFDVQAVCSGFVYGLAIADNFIKTRQCKTIVLIGAETFSRILDWEDRSTCVLFGDGAGAVVLRAGEGGGDANVGETGHNRGRDVLSTHLHSDGSTNDLLYVDGGPSSTQTVGHVRMVGREVYRHAVINLAAIVGEALEANGLPRKTSIGWSPIRPTSAFSTAPPRGSAWRKKKWSSPSTATPTRRPLPSRWRLTKRSATAASSAATLCSWKRWAAA